MGKTETSRFRPLSSRFLPYAFRLFIIACRGILFPRMRQSIHYPSSVGSTVMSEARLRVSILVLAILLGGGFARAAAPGESKPAARQGLPADLDLVPRDAAGFVHGRL